MVDVLFISQQYLREKSIINDNTDWELLQPTIIGVQDIYLEQILGTIFYEDLKNKIDSSTLSTDETNLIKNYIQPILLWYVQMEAMPIFKYRFVNKGVMVKQSENSQPISEQELDKQMDRFRIKAEVYAQRLTRYLMYNSNVFPKYKEYQLEGKFPNANNFTTGIDLGDFRPIKYTNDSGDICR
jgi:hypothetical protein